MAEEIEVEGSIPPKAGRLADFGTVPIPSRPTGEEGNSGAGVVRRLPGAFRGLSARLLMLTALFVMISEVFIFAPSGARFRQTYLLDKLEQAHLAMLAVRITPSIGVHDVFSGVVMKHTGTKMISLREPTLGGVPGRKLLLGTGVSSVDKTVDLRDPMVPELILDAFETLMQTENRVLRVMAPSPREPDIEIEVVIDEEPMAREMWSYANRIFWLSIAIAGFTAALLNVSLQFLIVRPIRRFTARMIAFRENPEAVPEAPPANRRTDEIGVAQREFARMEADLRAALAQKTRLAALGSAVTKINHDLRNILSSAILVSDRLAGNDDPEVKRQSGPIVAALNRAQKLCEQTVRYARDGAPELRREHFDLAELVEEAGEGLFVPSGADGGRYPFKAREDAVWDNRVADGLVLFADRDHLFRVFANLGRNAWEAGARSIRISARRQEAWLLVEIADDGPGLPKKAQDNLFKPFAGSARSGGSGLGLAISGDIVRAHGGDIRLVHSSANGTLFEIMLPLDAKTTRSRTR